MFVKSKQYIDAGQAIINTKGCLSVSVVCSYYSVFIYMKAVLVNTEKRPLTLFDVEDSSKDLHSFVLDQIIERYKGRDSGDFRERFENFHSERISADYSDKTYTPEEAMEWHSEANSLIAALKRNFGNLE